MEMLNPKLHRPSFGDEIDFNATFDVDTPPSQTSSSQHHSKKPCLERARSPVQDVLKKIPKVSRQEPQLSLGGQRCIGEPDEELAGAFPLFIRNAVLGQKQPNRTTAASRCSTDVVRIGFDGLGGRTKFIQPTDTAIIRPMPVKPKARSKQKVRIKTGNSSSQPTMDTFLWQ